jgi:hypothetical protein
MPYTEDEVKEMRRQMGITDEPEPIKPVISPAFGIGDITADYICLENIACVDADGNVFEQYPNLYVRRDIEKDADGKILYFTAYDAAAHLEQKAMRNPSFALHCNIAAALYAQRQEPELNKVLMQYKDKGNGNGGHKPNTLISYAGQEVMHNPYDSDFPSDGGNSNINTGRRVALGFSKQGLKSMPLEQALNDSVALRFAKQLTGMANPELIVELGKYFGKEAHLWVPNGDASNCNDTRAAWLGCSNNNFYLDADYDLDYNNAARGVRSS